MIKKNGLSDKEYEFARKEADIIIEHPHPNIITCMEYFEESIDNSTHFIILFEYCPVSFQIKFDFIRKF